MTGSSPTATAPGTGTVGNGQTITLTHQGTSTATITDLQTVNGLLPTSLHPGGFYSYTGNGSSLDAFGFPGYGTITTNALTKFLDGTGATTASSMVDNGSGVTVGSPTGGAEGAGTINATNLYINGTAVGAGTFTVEDQNSHTQTGAGR